MLKWGVPYTDHQGTASQSIKLRGFSLSSGRPPVFLSRSRFFGWFFWRFLFCKGKQIFLNNVCLGVFFGYT